MRKPIKPAISMAEAERRFHERLQAAARDVEMKLPEPVAFAIVLLSKSTGEYGGYTGNCKDPALLVRALRAAADDIERKHRANAVAPNIILPH